MKRNSATNMKKISLYFIGMAMLGMVMTSCQKEEFAGDTIVCTFENNDTKTHLAEGRDHDYITNKWDNADALNPEQIMVVYPSNKPTRTQNGTTYNADARPISVKYTALDVRADGMQAEFGHEASTTVDFSNMNAIGGKIELYYPAASFVSCTSQVDVTRAGTSGHRYHTYANYNTTNRKIKLDYYQNKNNSYSHDTRDWPMFGTVTRTTSGGCSEASMYNLCGGLRLQLKSNDFHAAVTKITVWTDDKALVGEFTLGNTPTTLEGHAVSGETHLCAQTYTINDNGADNSNKRRIVYQPSQNLVPLDATNYTDFDICLPCGTYNNLYIRIEGVDGQYCVKKLNTGNTLTIKRDELKVIQWDLDYTTPEGAVFAYYSVSPEKSVFFAKGNLRYEGSVHTHTGRWYFAEHQWDMLVSPTVLKQERTGAFGRYTRGDGRIRHWVDGDGSVHNNTTWTYGANNDRGGTRHTYYDNSTNNVWELFGWSSGVQDHYGVANERGSNNDLQHNGYYNNNGNAGFVDWGMLPIENGGNQPHQWRTLAGGTYTPDRENFGEWDYLLNHRITDGKIVYNLPSDYAQYAVNGQTKASWAVVRVDGIPGILLFPDRFQWSQTNMNVNRIPRILNVNPGNWTSDDVLDYTTTEIEILAGTQTTSCGCTFLPAAGSREGYTTEQICYLLRYWLASEPDRDNEAFYIGFTEADDVDRATVPADSTHNLYWGRAVRLVMDAEPWDTRGTDNPWIEKGGNGSKGVATKLQGILRKNY